MKRIRTTLVIFISLAILYLAFRSINWLKIISSLQNYDASWLLPAVILVVFSIYLRAVRWMLILKSVKKIDASILFESIILSHFINILLPINLGEIVKAYMVKKKSKVSMSSIFGSIAIERILSMLGFLVVGFFVFIFVSLPPDFAEMNSQVLNGLKISAIAFFLLIIAVFLAQKYRKSITAFLKFITLKANKKSKDSILGVYENFLKGLRFSSSKLNLFIIILYSILIRIVFAIILMSIAKGFGVKLPLMIFLFIDILVSFVHGIGGHILGMMGTYEIAITYSLAFFGISKEIGLSVALIADFTFIIPSMILGIIYFLKEGLTMKKLRSLH